MSNVIKYTQSVGAYRPWQYVKFACEDEDPVRSYGDANVNFLNVSLKYDPGQTFQMLVLVDESWVTRGSERKSPTSTHSKVQSVKH